MNDKKRIMLVILFFGSVTLEIIFKIFDFGFGILLAFSAMIYSIIFLFKHNSKENKKTIENFIDGTSKYIINNKVKVSKSLFSDTMSSRIIFDHDNKKIHILKYGSKYVTINYSNIVESELIENGNTLTKTSRGSQLSGAVIGGVLAGGVGAVIGGLSGNTKSSKEIKKLELKIVSNNLNNPVNTFYIKDSINEYDKGSVLYEKMYDTAYELQKIISLIIKDNS